MPYPDAPMLSAFIAASVLLAVTPGPGVLYIVARSASQGRSAGLASVGGVALGNLGNAIGASLGLAALFAASSVAFTVVKWAGAGYLVYLGLRALHAAPQALTPLGAPPLSAPLRRVFRDGCVVALFNPKTTIFFAAFLPQFMRSDASAIAQSMALGTLFVAIAAVTDAGYALAAGILAPRLARARQVCAWARGLTGGTFISLGVFAALSDTRAPKA